MATKELRRELCSYVYDFLLEQRWTDLVRDRAGLNNDQMRLVRKGTCPVGYVYRLMHALHSVVAEGQSDIERCELDGLRRSIGSILNGMTAAQHLEFCKELYHCKTQE